MKKGIDLSKWNGTVDFDKVKAAGIEFVMLRAGYGKNNIDPKFHEYAAACSRLGIPFGVYWFSYAHTVEMARNEAKYCLAAIQDCKVVYPVAWDYEYDSTAYLKKQGKTETRQLVTDMALAFVEEVKAAGYKEMVYLNPDYLNHHFDERAAALPLWIAQWPSTVSFDNPPSGAKIWQYSSKGKVDGVSGNVDMDVCYADYEGEPAAPDGSGDVLALLRQALEILGRAADALNVG